MVSLQHLDKDDFDGISAAVAKDGGCIALNVLSHELCDQLLTDFDTHLDKLDEGIDELGYRNEFYGRQTKRLHGLFSKSARMVEVLTNPLFLKLARNLFVETEISRDIRLSNAELMVLYNGQQAQDFHTDGGSWWRIQKSEANEILISANCALTEFTATNGATRVVPGSHLWPDGRTPEESEVCLAEMPRGSALIYSGNLVHSGGTNNERDRRVGLYLGYIASWLRPIENQLVTNDPADIFALSEEAQRLLDVSPGGFTVIA